MYACHAMQTSLEEIMNLKSAATCAPQEEGPNQLPFSIVYESTQSARLFFIRYVTCKKQLRSDFRLTSRPTINLGDVIARISWKPRLSEIISSQFTLELRQRKHCKSFIYIPGSTGVYAQDDTRCTFECGSRPSSQEPYTTVPNFCFSFWLFRKLLRQTQHKMGRPLRMLLPYTILGSRLWPRALRVEPAAINR